MVVLLALLVAELDIVDLDLAHILDDLDSLRFQRFIQLFQLFGIKIAFA